MHRNIGMYEIGVAFENHGCSSIGSYGADPCVLVFLHGEHSKGNRLTAAHISSNQHINTTIQMMIMEMGNASNYKATVTSNQTDTDSYKQTQICLYRHGVLNIETYAEQAMVVSVKDGRIMSFDCPLDPMESYEAMENEDYANAPIVKPFIMFRMNGADNHLERLKNFPKLDS